MIGSLQRNKASVAASLFDVVHSVDRVELAEALESSLEKTEQLQSSAVQQALPVLIEVNITGEESKSGVATRDLPGLAEVVSRCKHLVGVGLMTLQAWAQRNQKSGAPLLNYGNCWRQLKITFPGDWHHLSMGMSDDYGQPSSKEPQ